MENKMKAVILAGGMGTRLKPIIGNDRPKVMVEYADKPLLHRTVDILRERDFKEIIIVVSHMKEKIMEYFGDGSDFGIKIDYAVQENPKGGTADAVRAAKGKVGNDKFLLVYGDNVFEPSTIDRLLEMKDHFDGVMCGAVVEDPTKFGVIQTDGYTVKKIWEKPEKPPSNMIMTGLFIMPPQIFSAIEKTGLSKRGEYELTDSIQILIDEGYKIGFISTKGMWMDPNSKEDIDKVSTMLKGNRSI